MRKILSRIAWGVVFFVLGANGTATLAGFFSSRGWIFDIAAAFRPVYMATQGATVVLLAAKKRWLGVFAAAVFFAINGQQIAPLYFPPQKDSPSGSASPGLPLRVLQLNSAIKNTSLEKVLAYADSVDADFFAIEEVSRSFGLHLEKQLAHKYPHRFSFLVDSGAGVALFSKHPLVDPQIVYFADPGLPSIVTDVQVHEERFTLVVTHPLSPTTPHGYRLRNRQLRAIAEARNKYSERLVVVGDLNVTSWSSVFPEFLKTTGLLDTRKGFGVQPTWPTLMPGSLALIPIDHCLVSEHFTVVDRRVGPDVGSDHLPLVVDLALRK